MSCSPVCLRVSYREEALCCKLPVLMTFGPFAVEHLRRNTLLRLERFEYAEARRTSRAPHDILRMPLQNVRDDLRPRPYFYGLPLGLLECRQDSSVLPVPLR